MRNPSKAALLAVGILSGASGIAHAQQQGFVGPGCSQDASASLNDAAFRGVEREVAVIDSQIDRPESLASLSCLERLLNSGVDIFFQPPGIGDILSSLQNAVCNAAESAWAEATAPLNNAVYRTVDLGGFIPGGGSLGGGVNTSVRRGDGRTGTFGSANDDRVRIEAPPVQVPSFPSPSGPASTGGIAGGAVENLWQRMLR